MTDAGGSGGRIVGATRKVEVRRGTGAAPPEEDLLAVEEPLEIRVVAGEGSERRAHSIAVTMRTPGHDFELAAGFLLSEGVLAAASELWRMARCDGAGEEAFDNIVEAHLRPDVDFDPNRFSRHVYTTSSCGVCGKASIERLMEVQPATPVGDFRLGVEELRSLPEKLLGAQPVFSRTGGLHAAALFDSSGDLRRVREDVGRHNAVDKIVGASVLAEEVPLSGTVLLVSGRASFELVQKALMAGIPALLAVGAPSSLAVETARDFGMTLVGFLKSSGFNIYSGEERISGAR